MWNPRIAWVSAAYDLARRIGSRSLRKRTVVIFEYQTHKHHY